MEKIYIFLKNLQGFDLHIAGGGGYTVSLACSQFLVTQKFIFLSKSDIFFID